MANSLINLYSLNMKNYCNKVKIVFIGNSVFAEKILKKLIHEKYNLSLVITNPDRPAGRNKKLKETEVSFISQKNNIYLLKPEKILDAKKEIKNQSPDLIIVCDYGQIIPESILKIPKKGCLNVHPSLLPLYRGPSPIRESILNNDKETGATIMLMNEKLDKGPIISQKKTKIKSNITYPELFEQLLNLSGNLLIETVPKWMNGKIKLKKQNNDKASYTKIITKKDGKIDWSLSAVEIEKKIRAFNPWPGTYSFYQDKKTKKNKMIKIIEAEIQNQTKSGPFGPLGKIYMATNNRLAIQTGKDFLIIKKLQLESKKPVNTEEFINGNIDFIGTILK